MGIIGKDTCKSNSLEVGLDLDLKGEVAFFILQEGADPGWGEAGGKLGEWVVEQR